MKHKNVKFLLIAGLVLFLAACTLFASPGQNGNPGSDAPSAPTQQLGVQKTQETAPNQPAAPAQPQPAQSSSGPGAFNLEDPSVGLSTLASYRQSLVLVFDGTVGGTETHSKTSLRRAVTTQPASQITWVELDGQPQQMYAKVGEFAYQQTGADGLCAGANSQSADASVAVFNLQTLPTLRGAEAAGEETVNGVPSKHYTFDERALGQPDQGKAKGEVWVAAQGGYVVKYTLRIEGQADQLGPGVVGAQTWEYQLTDPNALAAPDLPAACASPQAVEVAPLPADAQNVTRLPGFIAYTSPQAADQVAKFYQDQIDAQGWKAINSGQPVGEDTVLNFTTKDGGVLSIRIHPQEGGTKVTMQVLSKPAQ